MWWLPLVRAWRKPNASTRATASRNATFRRLPDANFRSSFLRFNGMLQLGAGATLAPVASHSHYTASAGPCHRSSVVVGMAAFLSAATVKMRG